MIAAFALLPALGLNRTVWVGVAVNVLVFFIAAALARNRRDSIYPQAPLQLGVRRIGRARHDVLQKRFDAGHPFAQLRYIAG